MLTFTGDKASKLVHAINPETGRVCPILADTRKSDREEFESLAEAPKAGYKPCSFCIPRPNR